MQANANNYTTDSMIREVLCLKEENAAEYGFDIRMIAAAAQLKQRQHPERIVTRILSDTEQKHGTRPLTHHVAITEL